MTTIREAVTGDDPVGQVCSSAIEIDAKSEIRAVAFGANGEYFVDGGSRGVRVWRVGDSDGENRMSNIQVEHVRCISVSKDGNWVAAGTYNEVIVWATETHERVFAHREAYVNGVDFSPDSTRLVTGSLDSTASIWDVAARQRAVGPLHHQDVVIAARFSPDGTRIATATPGSVRVWDGNDGRLLLDIQVKVPPWYNNGVLWSRHHLFVVSDSRIKKIDLFTGAEVSGWSVPDSNDSSCIALPQHSEYIAYATNRTVTIWDTSTHVQLGLIEHPQDIRSIALSPDDRSLVIGGDGGKITTHCLTHLNDSIPLSRLHPTFQEPHIQIDDATLDLWKHDQLKDAEALLTAAIPASQKSDPHVLASRALVRTRLRQWDAALIDAEESIKIRPSIVGYIAKSIALVGKGEKYDGYRTCDIAFERFHSTHVSFLLLTKAVIVFLADDHVDAISRVEDLIATVQFNSICHVVQAYMHFHLGCLLVERQDYERAIKSFERAQAQMRHHASRPLFVLSLISGWKFDDLDIEIQKYLCEAFYMAGRTKEAGESLLKMVNTIDEVCLGGPIATWVSDFVQRCLSTPESNDDAASDTARSDTVPTPLLREWARFKLANGSWEDALAASVSFVSPKFTIYRAVCERLEAVDQMVYATNCFQQMMRELRVGNEAHAEEMEWILDFKQRFSEELERRGDVAVDAQQYVAATAEYSAALSLDPPSPQGLFIKRSETYMDRSLWEDALGDANEVIKLDPSSPWGYERKHAALHKIGNYDGAIGAFETMLSKMAVSPDPDIRAQHHDYVNPSETKAAIQKAVQDAIRDIPRVLINTTSGRLLNKSKQASSFESLPVFKEMVSSMTTNIDDTRIKQEVAEYYRYATFSHKWEDNEPLFEKVIHIVVYDLEQSPTHDKLRTFCNIVRDAGFNWAWSDTCCINKSNHFLLQEALVAMFKWYEGSSLTVIFLRDVYSPSRRGDLVGSIWNKRAWTFQEYHAAKVVRFYTEDWTPYLNLDIRNHKDSPEIISEMEEATGVSAQTLMALRPGLDDIREKLCLASRRETTLVEDAAYSLLGVFSTALPIVYGEGDKALGRLLAQLLTSSGDTSILAWTGKSGSYNTCLPTNITVFDQLATSHIPSTINEVEMDSITARLQASSLNISQAKRLYDRLNELPVPLFAGNRMKLPCITFKLGPVAAPRSKLDRVFRAQTTGLGIVEIRTKEDLSRFDSLYLVHPWIDFLLQRHPVGCGTESAPEEYADDHSSLISEPPPSPSPSNTPSTTKRSRGSRLAALLQSLGRPTTPPRDAPSLLPPLSESQVDRRMRALQCIARLRRPFGALLFTPKRQNVAEYKRVASESTILVQVQEDAPLGVLIENARMLDVL